MNGFDYEELKPKEMAGGRRTLLAGRCVGPITHKKSLIVKDLKFTLSKTKTRKNHASGTNDGC